MNRHLYAIQKGIWTTDAAYLALGLEPQIEDPLPRHVQITREIIYCEFAEEHRFRVEPGTWLERDPANPMKKDYYLPLADVLTVLRRKGLDTSWADEDQAGAAPESATDGHRKGGAPPASWTLRYLGAIARILRGSDDKEIGNLSVDKLATAALEQIRHNASPNSGNFKRYAGAMLNAVREDIPN